MEGISHHWLGAGEQGSAECSLVRGAQSSSGEPRWDAVTCCRPHSGMGQRW